MKEGQVDRTKEVLRMISTTVRYVACTCISESLSSKVRGWVEEGVIAESTIYTWCVLNEPAGWQVGVHQID